MYSICNEWGDADTMIKCDDSMLHFSVDDNQTQLEKPTIKKNVDRMKQIGHPR